MLDKEEIIKFLIKNNVFRFGDFTLKSGIKSSYFYNVRNLNTGESLSQLSEYYVNIIEKNDLNFDVIVGPSYAGIPLACGICYKLAKRGKNIRFVYDRKEIKEYGDKKDKIFVGTLNKGDRILIVDDMITDGGTKIELMKKLKSLGKNLEIVGLVVLFIRQKEGTIDKLKNIGLETYYAINTKDIFEYLHIKK